MNKIIYLSLIAVPLFASPASAGQLFPPVNRNECGPHAFLAWDEALGSVKCVALPAIPVCPPGQLGFDGANFLCADPATGATTTEPGSCPAQTLQNVAHGYVIRIPLPAAPNGTSRSMGLSDGVEGSQTCYANYTASCISGTWTITSYVPQPCFDTSGGGSSQIGTYPLN